MTLSPVQSLVLTAVQQVSPDRLQKAACGLADGSMTVTLTCLSGAEIRALVKNGNGAEYGVTLTEALTTCSCKDALYHGGVCKHATATALHVLRTPQLSVTCVTTTAVPALQFPSFHLSWRDGLILCGAAHPARTQMWPWTQGMLTWPEVCPACTTAYMHPKPAAGKAA